jgi:hypothetical protein
MSKLNKALEPTMQNEINTLLETIKNDYFNWTTRNGTRELSEHNATMVQQFNDGLEVKEGNKYIKVISNRSVWGFVVKGDNDKKFTKGDILKAAGYNAPARNAARGNIVDGGYKICWTGPLYLK